MALHSCPELGQSGWVATECGLPKGERVILVEGAFCGRGSPEGLSAVFRLRSCDNEPFLGGRSG